MTSLLDLPNEVILNILTYFRAAELIPLQLVSARMLTLARDGKIWRALNYLHSPAEMRKRNPDLATAGHVWGQIPEQLATMFENAVALAESQVQIQGHRSPDDHSQNAHPHAASKDDPHLSWSPDLAWDPTFPSEAGRIDWYGEFVARHANAYASFFETAGPGSSGEEVTGAGILFDATGYAEKLVAPADDGSIAIWDARTSSIGFGSLLGRSQKGVLAGFDASLRGADREACHDAMTAAPHEGVSVDSTRGRAYVAVKSTLTEVDLTTLQVVSRTDFPTVITALSPASPNDPLTVAINRSIHLYDPRLPTPLSTPAPLAQPGALSIAHPQDEIWVAGRFTSLLSYDRRFFPRLRGTQHTGGNVSSLFALPHPFVSRPVRQHNHDHNSRALAAARASTHHSLLAAGSYNGRGSLELFDLSASRTKGSSVGDKHINRVTASRSRILCAVPDGTRIAYADAGGSVRWVERDGATAVRDLCVNKLARVAVSRAKGAGAGVAGESVDDGSDSDLDSDDDADGWTFMRKKRASDARFPRPRDEYVRRLLPTVATWGEASAPAPLVFWNSGGALGTVSFGRPAVEEAFYDALEEQMGDVSEGEHEARDKYNEGMRRALEMQAREIRWLRGYGLEV